MEIREAIRDKLDTASPEEKRWVLEMLSARVLMWKDRLEVEIAVPKERKYDARGVSVTGNPLGSENNRTAFASGSPTVSERNTAQFAFGSPGPPAGPRKGSDPATALPRIFRNGRFCCGNGRHPPGPANGPYRQWSADEGIPGPPAGSTDARLRGIAPPVPPGPLPVAALGSALNAVPGQVPGQIGCQIGCRD